MEITLEQERQWQAVAHDYFDRLLPRPHYGLPTWSTAAAVALALCITFYSTSGSLPVIATFGPLSVSIIALPIGVKIGHQILLDLRECLPQFLEARPGEDVDRWYYLHFAEYLKADLVKYVGIAYSSLAIVAFTLSSAFQTAPAAFIPIGVAIVETAGLFAGFAVATVYYVSRAFWRMGEYKIRVANHQFGVMAVGSALTKVYMIAAVLWCLVTSSAAVGLPFRWYAVGMLAAPAVLVITGCFVVCQIPLHRRMVQYKRNRLRELEETIKRLTPREPTQLSDELLKRLEFYQARLTETINLPEWPFRWKQLATVASASAGTVLPVVVGAGLDRLIL